MTTLFFDDIMAFHEMMYQQRSAETEKEMKRRRREVGQARKRNSGNWKKRSRQISRKSIPMNRTRAILTASPRLSASMWG